MVTELSEGQDESAYLAVTFFVQDTLCGVDTARVQEVVRLERVTPVHHAAPYIVGVINLRGKIITIIELGRKLGLRDSDSTDQQRVLIVQWKGEFVGIRVDRVSDVVQIDRAGISTRPTVAGGIPSVYFQGVFQGEGRLIGLLDIDAVLSADEPANGGR